jgi:hypothetical protein
MTLPAILQLEGQKAIIVVQHVDRVDIHSQPFLPEKDPPVQVCTNTIHIYL